MRNGMQKTVWGLACVGALLLSACGIPNEQAYQCVPDAGCSLSAAPPNCPNGCYGGGCGRGCGGGCGGCGG